MLNRKMKLIIFTCIFLSITMIILSALAGKTVTILSENAVAYDRTVVVIDAGHGGIDSGATSISGIAESKLNLEVALMLQDMFHLLGIKTIMIRTEDISIYTSGNTIAEQKISDLKERVRIVNSYSNAILISIHQNYFSDSRYSGAQTFYSQTPGSKELASALQSAIVQTLNQGSKRSAKNADGVYLMEHIQTCGVLIECGFLSNAREEALLRDSAYQKKICCVVASVLSRYLGDCSDFT